MMTNNAFDLFEKILMYQYKLITRYSISNTTRS